MGGAIKGKDEQQVVIKKGVWSREEDAKLVEVVAMYGHGRWNFLAHAAGLHRTGKSCRLRWLNYLRPNVRHGGFSLSEQLLILQLHFRWGNRWSKIAEQLPGRTDNDIKNYWRTRIIRYARHLNCDVNSLEFKSAIRDVWIPTLLERITSGSASDSESGSNIGQAYPPLNSPQDVSGPDPNDDLIGMMENPVDECGQLGSTENQNGPVGFTEFQNSTVGMVNGSDLDPYILEPNPYEFGFDLDMEACHFSNTYGEEEDIFVWQEHNF